MENTNINTVTEQTTRNEKVPEESLDNLKGFLGQMKNEIELKEIQQEISAPNTPIMTKSVEMIVTIPDDDIQQVEDLNENNQSTNTLDVIKQTVERKKSARKNIDLENIVVKIPKDKKDYLLLRKKRLEALATYQVALPKSGYYAELLQLSSLEIQNLALSSQTNSKYVYRQKLLRLVYDKIKNTSIGKLSFTDFLHITAESELNILLYGIYCITYKDINEYSITCDGCGKQYTLARDNKDLLILKATQDAETILSINNIIMEVSTPEELKAKSFVSNISRLPLTNGCIYEIKEPSLYDSLDRLYRNIDEEKYKDDITLAFIRFVDSILIPTDDDEYIKITDFESIYSEFKSLGDEDYYTVSEVMTEISEKNQVRFGLRDMVCPHCSHKSEDSIIDDMEMLVFLQHQSQMEKFRGEGTGSN